VRVPRPPTDLFAYQELVARLRPDWIIDIRAGSGGLGWFFATLCDLVGNGQVIAIESKEPAKRPRHDRLRYITGQSVDEEVVDEVHSLVGRPGNALVILGARAPARRISDEHQAYSDLVPVGGYVVVEDTILNGHPVWPNFGVGPAEAVKGIVERRENFAIDVEMNKYRLSFNPNGFLRRMS
jgi:cephalosporin hydroxylase